MGHPKTSDVGLASPGATEPRSYGEPADRFRGRYVRLGPSRFAAKNKGSRAWCPPAGGLGTPGEMIPT